MPRCYRRLTVEQEGPSRPSPPIQPLLRLRLPGSTPLHEAGDSSVGDSGIGDELDRFGDRDCIRHLAVVDFVDRDPQALRSTRGIRGRVQPGAGWR